jgi:hypothetical protein
VEYPGPGEEQRDERGVQGEGTHEAAAELIAVEGDVEGAGCEAGFHGLRRSCGEARINEQEQTKAKY